MGNALGSVGGFCVGTEEVGRRICHDRVWFHDTSASNQYFYSVVAAHAVCRLWSTRGSVAVGTASQPHFRPTWQHAPVCHCAHWGNRPSSCFLAYTAMQQLSARSSRKCQVGTEASAC
jgi:hypothetical protein